MPIASLTSLSLEGNSFTSRVRASGLSSDSSIFDVYEDIAQTTSHGFGDADGTKRRVRPPDPTRLNGCDGLERLGRALTLQPVARLDLSSNLPLFLATFRGMPTANAEG